MNDLETQRSILSAFWMHGTDMSTIVVGIVCLPRSQYTRSQAWDVASSQTNHDRNPWVKQHTGTHWIFVLTETIGAESKPAGFGDGSKRQKPINLSKPQARGLLRMFHRYGVAKVSQYPAGEGGDTAFVRRGINGNTGHSLVELGLTECDDRGAEGVFWIITPAGIAWIEANPAEVAKLEAVMERLSR